MAEPFIKLYKKMLKWEWYDDTNTKILFLHCLLKANWCPAKWHGVDIEPGQFITSLATLAKETKLSVRQVRVALDHLIMTGEVTSKCQSKYRIITVNSWNEYQGSDKQGVKQMTSKRQASDKQVTTVKEIKEIKEEKENNIFTPPTVDEVRTYCQERNNSVDAEAFVSFYESKGWLIGKNKMKDWRAAVRTWERSRKDDKQTTAKPTFSNFNERKYDSKFFDDFK